MTIKLPNGLPFSFSTPEGEMDINVHTTRFGAPDVGINFYCLAAFFRDEPRRRYPIELSEPTNSKDEIARQAVNGLTIDDERLKQDAMLTNIVKLLSEAPGVKIIG